MKLSDFNDPLSYYNNNFTFTNQPWSPLNLPTETQHVPFNDLVFYNQAKDESKKYKKELANPKPSQPPQTTVSQPPVQSAGFGAPGMVVGLLIAGSLISTGIYILQNQ